MKLSAYFLSSDLKRENDNLRLCNDFMIALLARFLTFSVKEAIVVICEAQRRSHTNTITTSTMKSAIEADENIRYIFGKVFNPAHDRYYDRFEYSYGNKYYAQTITEMLTFSYPEFKFEISALDYLIGFAKRLIDNIADKFDSIQQNILGYKRNAILAIKELTTVNFFLDFTNATIEDTKRDLN